MARAAPFSSPDITDEDVQWVCSVLGLPQTAFRGPDGRDPRQEILKSVATLDVEACPGSGKTTLLVAKLAILARKWEDARRGICILSHTNVARREIEKCLGGTPEGRQLLEYPHFVGTIHGFVNQFLAVPWLRSLGYPATTFDDQQCERHRRRLLGLNQYAALRTYVERREANPRVRVVSKWHLASPAFEVVKDSGEPEFANDTPAARQLQLLAATCAADGFHRYAEAFMWAHDLLSKYPEVAAIIRQRFPVLFIDEVQDNNELQSAIIHRVFIEGDTVAVRQRYGDSNQAIYGHDRDKGAESDVFPREEIRRDVPNSHRFGQAIATLANPFGLVPQGLVGCGPPTHTIGADTSDRNAIFLFSEETIARVLEEYSLYLQQIFSDQELLDGTFTAVGAVHRPSEEEGNVPRFVRHYWSDYDHELTASDPKPRTFFQYVAAGRKSTFETKETHGAVEKIAEGLLRLARLANPEPLVQRRRRKHLQILELLNDREELRHAYLRLVTGLSDPNVELLEESWDREWCDAVIAVAGALANTELRRDSFADFLTWPSPELGEAQMRHRQRRDNCYRSPDPASKVAIQVGSIHSVKGETHTATMVLETFFHGHHLHDLKPWLLGQNAGRGPEGVRRQSRLKQHYVAMTRPTHLLCLAMKDEFTPEEIEILKARSWRVGRIAENGVTWL